MGIKLRMTLAGLVSLFALAAYGGWASISVEDLPEYVVARQPVTLTFTVRQHGLRPLTGLEPRVEATDGTHGAAADTRPGAADGQYTATVALGDTGRWAVTIYSGFGNSKVTLLPIPAIAAGATPPRPADDADRGRHLFVAKGCVTCHLHRDVNTTSLSIGPELTGRHLPAEYLTRFLTDPQTVYGARNGMPNLRLRAPEIAALIAFINADREASGR